MNEMTLESWEVIEKYISKSGKAAELYHGNRTDILLGLSRIVGEEGLVYGVSNGLVYNFNTRTEFNFPQNVHLFRARIPPLPYELRDLAAVIIRGFEYACCREEDGSLLVEDSVLGYRKLKLDPNTSRSIWQSIKPGGAMIISFNELDRKCMADHHFGEKIPLQYPQFQCVYNHKQLMIFKKADL